MCKPFWVQFPSNSIAKGLGETLRLPKEGLLTLSPDLTADQRGAVAPGQRLGEELRAAVRQLLPRILGPCRGPQLADLPRQEMLAELEKGRGRNDANKLVENDVLCTEFGDVWGGFYVCDVMMLDVKALFAEMVWLDEGMNGCSA